MPTVEFVNKSQNLLIFGFIINKYAQNIPQKKGFLFIFQKKFVIAIKIKESNLFFTSS